MNPILDPYLARQRAQLWAAHLGDDAGGMPGTQAQARPPQPTGQTARSRLLPALAHLLQRMRRQEDTRDKLKANEFLAGD